MQNLNYSVAIAYYWGNVKKNASGVVFALVIIAFVCWLWIVVPLHQASDISGAATQQSMGVIVGVANRVEIRGTGPVKMNILTVRLHGEDIVCNSPALVSIGEPVRVYYQIGKSGVVYINHVEHSQP